MQNKIGLGTAAIGRPQYINIKKVASVGEFSIDKFRASGIAMLDSAYEKGIRYFDTAPGYGMAERMLIDWAVTKDDPSIEIASKWGYTYVADFDPNATSHEIKEHSLAKLNEQWAVSKTLLPKLTTYQIHSATLETGVLTNEKVLRRLAHLKKEFGIHIGITTTGANQVKVLESALETKVEGIDLFDVFQVTYNIFDQSLASLAKKIAKRGKRIVIKEALANGRIFPNENYPHYAGVYRLLQDLTQKYGVGVDAIALRFCLDSIPLFCVLSGASEIGHLSDNLKVSEFKLSGQEIADLKNLAISPDEYWNERKALTWN